MRRFKLKLKSIEQKMAAIVLVILIPAILLLIYTSTYATSVMRQQTADSNRNFASLYLLQIDSALDDIDKYLNNLIALNLDLNVIIANRDADQIALSFLSLSNKMRQDVGQYAMSTRLFFYSESRDLLILATSGSYMWMEPEGVRTILHQMKTDSTSPLDRYRSGWLPVKLESGYSLLRIVPVDKTNYIGAWVSTDSLLDMLNRGSFGHDNNAFLTTNSGESMESDGFVDRNKIEMRFDEPNFYMTGISNRSIVVSEKSTKGAFSLFSVSDDNGILTNPPYHGAIVLTIVLSVLLVPIVLLLLRRLIGKPMRRVVNFIGQIGETNMEIRIPEDGNSEEFRLLNSTLNSMLDQIQTLKIDAYEKQLSKQQTELAYLKAQVNPHFFMNSLNIIYSLALIKDYTLIQDMVLSLVKYFRFMLIGNTTLVKLRDELEHIENYVHIQKLRFKGRLTCEITAAEETLNLLVPPLIMQGFIENSLKHGMVADQVMKLTICTELNREVSVNRLKIQIRDSGTGFAPNILKRLREGERITDARGEHIGIWNAMRRLDLLYGGDAAIVLDNVQPTGVAVEITLPAKVGETEGDANNGSTADC